MIALVLLATGLFLYLRFESNLTASFDQGLRSRADAVGLNISDGAPLTENQESFAQAIGPGGKLVDATPGLARRSVLSPAQLAQARRRPVFVDRGPPPGQDDPVRLLARPVKREGRTLVVVVVGSATDDRDDALASLRKQLLIGGPLALLLASLTGYGLASAALRPVASMRRRAAEISHAGSGQRLPVPAARDELAELGQTLNEMLGRLERSIERERSFVSSASHELRTPLALLKAELELALREGRSEAELRAAVASAAEESDRLVRLAEDLLVLARADQGRLPVRAESLDAGQLLRGVARRFEPRASSTGRELVVEPGEGAPIEADPLRAEQALGNLVDNAFRHGSGTVTLAAERLDGRVRLHVRDEGEGIPVELGESAFEPFTRGDRARTRGGTGLGLALVEAVAAAHGGRAAAGNGAEGGADVWIELPQGSE